MLPWQVDDVVDQVVRSLSKFSAVLQSGSQKSVAAFGESEKARLALETMFAVANRCSLCLRFAVLLAALLPWPSLC